MKDAIKELESKRKFLNEQLASMGDFRRGTHIGQLSNMWGKNCVCATPRHPGHGPQYLWNTTIKGKS